MNVFLLDLRKTYRIGWRFQTSANFYAPDVTSSLIILTVGTFVTACGNLATTFAFGLHGDTHNI